MKVLVLDPLLEAKDRFVINNIEEGYKALQAVIGGSAEWLTLDIFGKEYDFILDEEGKFKPEPLPNIALVHNSKLHDLIVGKVIISKADDEGRQIDLTDEDMALIQQYFKINPTILSSKENELLVYVYQ